MYEKLTDEFHYEVFFFQHVPWHGYRKLNFNTFYHTVDALDTCCRSHLQKALTDDA
jgi:hypothetical protein